MTPDFPLDDGAAARSSRLTCDRLAARPVALTGFMGVGKSSVGRAVADCLGRPFADTDDLVELRAGCSIPELFARGEPVFRRLEVEAINDVVAGPPGVIALGGGALSQPDCARLLLDRALVVHLYVPWRLLLPELTKLTQDRPLLRGREPWQVQELYLRRMPDYRKAHLRIRLSRSGLAEATRDVAAVLRR